jgi:hypothetical protein
MLRASERESALKRDRERKKRREKGEGRREKGEEREREREMMSSVIASCYNVENLSFSVAKLPA